MTWMLSRGAGELFPGTAFRAFGTDGQPLADEVVHLDHPSKVLARPDGNLMRAWMHEEIREEPRLLARGQATGALLNDDAPRPRPTCRRPQCPLVHHLASGAAERRQTCAAEGKLRADLFDSQLHLMTNREVARAVMEAEAHFNAYGWREGRAPNSVLDVDGYRARCGDLAPAGRDPLGC